MDIVATALTLSVTTTMSGASRRKPTRNNQASPRYFALAVQALVALIGVAVGAVLTGVVNYYVQRRRSEEDERRERIAEERQARAAALVAAMELAEVEALADAPSAEAQRARRDSVWTERRELLAAHLGPVHAFPVALAFSLIDRATALEPDVRAGQI